MLDKVSYNQFVTMASQAPRVILYQEIYGDLITPTQVYHQLARDCANNALIEFRPRNSAGYAFIGLNALAEISASGNEVKISIDGHTEHHQGDPFELLRQLRQRITCADNHPLTKLTAGAIGYLSYDVVRTIEKLPDRHPKDNDIADLNLKFYRSSITFDLNNHKVFVCHVVDVGQDLSACYQQGMAAIAELIEKIFMPTQSEERELTNHSTSEFSVDINDDEYAGIVNKAKHYISIGDIFQVVPSRTFQKDFQGTAFDVYRALKKISPSPYHFCIKNEALNIVGASPEKIASVKNKIIDSVPLAGTRPRGTGKSDEQLAIELTKDPKEIAEHVMLVDLARNDVGAVSKPGSVKVTDYLAPISFSHVMHLASTVQGQLADGCDVIDVLKATFPAGTLSGAPKIRAMEIIDEIENSRRGIYGGAIVVLDRDDNLDTCITIRTALIKNKKVFVRAGGGIVHDSDPYTEANESRQKATSVMSAVKMAEGGLL